jgi:hypothetical protein
VREKVRERLRLSWKGALEDIKPKYNSVELQHEVLEFWAGRRKLQ